MFSKLATVAHGDTDVGDKIEQLFLIIKLVGKALIKTDIDRALGQRPASQVVIMRGHIFLQTTLD